MTAASANTCMHKYDGNCDEDPDAFGNSPECRPGTDTADCTPSMAEYSPVEFLYHATGCIVEGVGGALNGIAQLINALGSSSVDATTGVCEQMVSKISVRFAWASKNHSI